MTQPHPAPTLAFPRLAVLATALALVGGLALSSGAQAQTSLTVQPPPGPQDRGVPPTLEQYPLLPRIFGPGGAIFPGYVSPIDQNEDSRVSLLTGGGGRMVFAAGTADTRCQTEQAPTITILSAPAGVKLSTDYGNFTVDAVQAGSSFCLGRVIQGTRVFVTGRLPRGGATATLKVSYPQVGRLGRSYTHTVTLPAR
ncbi:hypothetical protein [Ancylobacter sp. SL191]|jgi:hypothetical protein|uniref:hypothetical protein n=1 Tax=Ancylobacter sp. SL191 TaxID=2995166 RepID=UPI0022716408|nr:hypothetical protein [Ancylobacter sp. SL191]WAC28134.1 hypothetical protein OU996_03460 [Ancylobacter sp. SL191]